MFHTFSGKRNRFFRKLDTFLSAILLGGTAYYAIEIFKFENPTPVYVPIILFGLCIFLFRRSKKRLAFEKEEAFLLEAPIVASDDENTDN